MTLCRNHKEQVFPPMQICFLVSSATVLNQIALRPTLMPTTPHRAASGAQKCASQAVNLHSLPSCGTLYALSLPCSGSGAQGHGTPLQGCHSPQYSGSDTPHCMGPLSLHRFPCSCLLPTTCNPSLPCIASDSPPQVCCLQESLPPPAQTPLTKCLSHELSFLRTQALHQTTLQGSCPSLS